MNLFDGDVFERGGRKFRFKTVHDDSMGPPWKEHDCHGPVREDHYGDAKSPGERLLHRTRWGAYFYDFAEATRIAKRDGWGLGEKDLAKLERKLGRKPSRKQIVREAVEQDFQYLAGWLNDDWSYVGIIIEEVKSDEQESLWGIESDCHDYHVEVADELADEINARLNDAFAAEVEASRPDMYPAPSINSDAFWRLEA
ncbi:hypothetical protein [Bradyrhizobium sp. Tv2a-2]|uniref:hypothetical protein n=1 Tax=Bradyrhizobium sp. Tv2a-2 TaxID=113395 RepID=UPI0003F89766|nr:hypothetical protein [Bradyrhizobium sp. Tv2a-2]